MPLPKDIFLKLVSGDLGIRSGSNSDYLHKIPTLGEDVFPDDIRIKDLSMSGGVEGRRLHKLLDEVGLSKGQRAGMTHLLSSFSEAGGSEMTVGDIRALTEEELKRLIPELNWGPPTPESVSKIKKLLG